MSRPQTSARTLGALTATLAVLAVLACAVGSGTTSDGQGRYIFNLPLGSGSPWVQASGGYTDEATTNAVAVRPFSSSLRSIITAHGGTVDSMLTPLTTLALNAAAATAGSTGTLNAAVFGANANSHGTALTAISRMVANGTTLAALLSTTNPQTLAAACAAAAVAPTAPAAPPTAPSGGSVALSFSGATDVGPVDTAAFTPGNSTLLQACEFGVGNANEFLTITANASVAASSITVRLSGVSLSPGALFRGLPTTGAFVANGDITAPIQT